MDNNGQLHRDNHPKLQLSQAWTKWHPPSKYNQDRKVRNNLKEKQPFKLID